MWMNSVVGMVVGLVGVVVCAMVAGNARGQPAAGVDGHPAGWMDERWRPQFHFTPEKNWMNDPNGLVYFEGEWHLFYQYNPHGDQWGHMSWGHAVSADLVHWEHLALAIPEENGVMAFSGSAVVDWKNTSGFGVDGKPPLVAIYTGHRVDGSNQSQFIASSTDKGRTWERYRGNPVLDEKLANFRDPKVCWYEKGGVGYWVMAVSVSEERKVRFYKSADLKKWELLSEFGPAGSTEGVWECPDLFELPVEGEKPRTGGGPASKWVLVVSVSGGGPTGGNGVQYFVGEFNGERFVADDFGGPAGERPAALWVDSGPDSYAPQTWSDAPDGRRIMIGWMVNGQYAGAVPTSPWRSAMTVPRVLTLRKTDKGVVRLFQEPVKELEALRGERIEIKKGSIEGVNMQLFDKGVKGELLEIAATFRAGGIGAEKFGINVRVGANGEKTVIGYDTASGKVFVDRRKAGESGFQPAFAGVGVHEAAVEMRDGMLSLRVWVDRSSVEVFANDGEVSMTELILPDAGSTGVEVWSESRGTLVEGMEVWRLKSVWRGK